MSSRAIHRWTAFLVFTVSLVQYLLTVQPSVSFWDAAEIAAAAKLLQVPHPPGAPLFLLIGRLFYMLPISESMGLRVNLLSVLSTSGSVLFLYLSLVKLLARIPWDTEQRGTWRWSRSLAAAIGALAFSSCDTVWFNGVEAEVFALSTLIFAVIFWLIVTWLENPEGPHRTKILLLIVYLTGLSAGVHLMSVLAIAFVAFLVMLMAHVRNDAACKESALVLLGHIGAMALAATILLGAQTDKNPPTYEEFHAFDVRFALIMAGISVVWMFFFRKHVFTRNSVYAALGVGGVTLATLYPGIVKYLPKLLVALVGDSNSLGFFVLVALMALGGGIVLWATRRRKPLVQFITGAVLLAMAGYTVYATIVFRANQDPPMNENSPKTFSGLGSYISREQYGDWPVFKRRFTQEAHQQGVYSQYSSDLDFLLRYQMGHMFTRYVLWNFAGRESTIQDVGVRWGQLFGVPFFVGLVGLFYHFRKDWKVAVALLLLFILMGYVTAFYQNQQEPQPRERDYFYPGAFFVFALWIGLGIDGILRFVSRQKLGPAFGQAFALSILALGILFIPARMLATNWATHDRSRNWLPWDYSYNMLQSCEQDAILFTNGDNDTFPLWYLQDVEGIRRDVRIVNLSLGNTPWYIQQMKNAPYYAEAKSVPISFSDARIAAIAPTAWTSQTVSLDVPEDVYQKYNITDTATTNSHRISWKMNATLQAGSATGIRVQDMLVFNTVMTHRWARPIYFAITCAPDSKIGLDEYLWYRGFSWRLEPRRVPANGLGLDHAVLEKSVMQEAVQPSPTAQLGYLYRGLADSSVFLDENASRMLVNYRMAFLRLAYSYANDRGDLMQCAAVLDRMERLLPRRVRPMGLELTSDVLFLYHQCGREDQFREIAAEVETECRQRIAEGNVDARVYYNPYRVLLDIYEIQKRYPETVEILTELNRLYPGSPDIAQRLQAARSAVGNTN